MFLAIPVDVVIDLSREKKTACGQKRGEGRTDSAYIHILGTTYKARLLLALFSEILKNCDSFLQIKYGNMFGGVQGKNSQILEENLFWNFCFPERYPLLVLTLIRHCKAN